MRFFLYFILMTCYTDLSFSSFCPPVEFPCTCASSTMEPVSIRCTGPNSFARVLEALKPAKNALKIDSLAINATSIQLLPPKAFQGLNIVRLSIRKAGLTDIDPMAFDGPLLESITEIDLTDNNFTQIPSNSISTLKNLRKLILSKNQMTSLNPDSFSAYESKERLVCLDLSFNQIDRIDPAAIIPLKKLEELDLQGNSLLQVPSVALQHLKSTLKHLNLAINKIARIEPFAFDLPNLESLSLEYNQLADMTSEDLHGLPCLRYLYLTGNKLITWKPELFRHLCKLRNLGMGGNAITNIPYNAFAHMPRLLRLEMSGGLVSTVDSGAFQGAKCLQAIILNNNKLTEVKNDTFQGLTDLYTLDLAKNGIESIEEGAFSSLPNLKHLDLSGNELRMLEPRTFNDTFMASTDAKVLYLCRNPWLCNGTMDNLRRWLRENIDISIDKPDCAAVCKEPEWLTNWPIRFPNPPPPSDAEYEHLQNWPTFNPHIRPTAWPVTSTAPFLPPYVKRTWHMNTIPPNTNTTITSEISPFLKLHRNPSDIDPSNDLESLPATTQALPMQVLSKKIPGSITKLIKSTGRNVSVSSSSKEDNYRLVKSILEGIS